MGELRRTAEFGRPCWSRIMEKELHMIVMLVTVKKAPAVRLDLGSAILVLGFWLRKISKVRLKL